MHLKLNLQTPSSTDAVNYYASLFDTTIIKEGINEGHAYIKLFNQISLHLHTNKSFNVNSPYIIIRFSLDEKEIFNKAIQRIKDTNGIIIKRDLTQQL